MANRNDFTIDACALRSRLDVCRVTQSELAEEVLGVTPNTVQNWLNGDTRCSEKNLVGMAEHLGVGMLDLTINCPKHYASRQSAGDSARSLVKLVEWAAGTSARLRKWLPFGAEMYEPIRAMVHSQQEIFDFYHEFIVAAAWPPHGFVRAVRSEDHQLHQYGCFSLRPSCGEAGSIEFAGGVHNPMSNSSGRKVIVKYGKVEWDEEGRVTATSYFIPDVNHGRIRSDGWIDVWSWLSKETREFILISPCCDFELVTDFRRTPERRAWDTATADSSGTVVRFPPGPHHRRWAQDHAAANLKADA